MQTMKPKNQELKLLLSLGLDYIRWTQLTPMLMAWGFALLVLALLVFVNFQQQAFSAMENLMQWLTQLPMVGEYFTARFSVEDSQVEIGTAELKTYALWGWFFVSLVFMLLNMALSAWLGPFQPWSLKRKIAYAGFASLLLLAALVWVYFTGSENFNGSRAGWMLNFSLWSLLVFLLSAYSLSAAHVLGRVSSALTARPVEQASG
jgi:hypothetical protein